MMPASPIKPPGNTSPALPDDINQRLVRRLFMAGGVIIFLLSLLFFSNFLDKTSPPAEGWQLEAKPSPQRLPEKVPEPLAAQKESVPATENPEKIAEEKADDKTMLPPSDPTLPALEPQPPLPVTSPKPPLSQAKPGGVVIHVPTGGAVENTTTQASAVKPIKPIKPILPTPPVSAPDNKNVPKIKEVPESSASPPLPVDNTAKHMTVIETTPAVNEASAPPISTTTKQPAKPIPATPIGTQFVLQAGVFNSVLRAEELFSKLQSQGIQSSLETRVQVGPFKTRKEAESAQVKLRALGIETLLIPPKP